MYNNNTLESKSVLHDVLIILAKDFLLLTPEAIRTYARIIEGTVKFTQAVDPRTLRLATLLTEHFQKSNTTACREVLVPILQLIHNKFVAVPNAKQHLAYTLNHIAEHFNQEWMHQPIRSQTDDDRFMNQALNQFIHSLDLFIKNEFILKSFHSDFGSLENSFKSHGIKEPKFSDYRARIFRPTTLPYLFTLHTDHYYIFQVFVKLCDEISAIEQNSLYSPREKLLKIFDHCKIFAEADWLLSTNISQLFSEEELAGIDVQLKQKIYDNLAKSVSYTVQFLNLMNSYLLKVAQFSYHPLAQANVIPQVTRNIKTEVKPATAVYTRSTDIVNNQSTPSVESFYEQGKQWMLRWWHSSPNPSSTASQTKTPNMSNERPAIKH